METAVNILKIALLGAALFGLGYWAARSVPMRRPLGDFNGVRNVRCIC